MHAIKYAWLRWQEIRRGYRPQQPTQIVFQFDVDTNIDPIVLARALRRELNRQATIGRGTLA